MAFITRLSPSPHFSPVRGMIAQEFVFTGNFLTERNSRAYFRVKKNSSGNKEQARARVAGEKCGLVLRPRIETLARDRRFEARFFDHLRRLVRTNYRNISGIWLTALPTKFTAEPIDKVGYQFLVPAAPGYE